MGGGVNCAMFDAYQLAQQITKHGLDDIDSAVAEYEKLMLPRGRDLIQRSRASGKLIFAPDAPRGLFELFGLKVDWDARASSGAKEIQANT